MKKIFLNKRIEKEYMDTLQKLSHWKQIKERLLITRNWDDLDQYFPENATKTMYCNERIKEHQRTLSGIMSDNEVLIINTN